MAKQNEDGTYKGVCVFCDKYVTNGVDRYGEKVMCPDCMAKIRIRAENLDYDIFEHSKPIPEL